MREPYDWDAYAEAFFPTAQELVRRASEAEIADEKEKASELYLYERPIMRPLALCLFLTGEHLLSTESHASLTHDHQSRSLLGRWARKRVSRVFSTLAQSAAQ